MWWCWGVSFCFHAAWAACTQGGTAAAPLQLNDRNREDPDNYWTSTEGCEYVVTLSDGKVPIDTLGESTEHKAARALLRPSSTTHPSCVLHRRGLGEGGRRALCGPGAVAGGHQGVLPAVAIGGSERQA